MKVNGHKIKPFQAWFDADGMVVVILSVNKDEDFPIKGIRSVCGPMCYDLCYNKDGTSISSSGDALVKPVDDTLYRRFT